ncbi:phosphate acetyltransferase [Austwickia chelonae]|uniref:phosphate acetyltransferase n=1 Tax=Austwickia chelonae TaxID=100225 RepID=UPI000E21DFAA|nr:phosphate acetyltransferase [Austwickia chelonae]
MSRRILVVPANHGADCTATALGLLQALDERGIDVGYLKPFAQALHGRPDHAVDLVRLVTPLNPPAPISVAALEAGLSKGQDDDLMEEVVALADETLSAHDVVVIEGLVPSGENVYSQRVNHMLAKALDAEVVVVGAIKDHDPQAIASITTGSAASYRVGEASRVLGIVLRRGAPGTEADYRAAFENSGERVVGFVEATEATGWPRVSDLAQELGLKKLNDDGDETRRIKSTAVLAQSMPGFLPALKDGQLVVVPADRHDVLVSAALATMNGVRLAGVLLTAGIRADERVLELCQPALKTGLPIYATEDHTIDAVNRVLSHGPEVAPDDDARTRLVMETTASVLDEEWVESLTDDRAKRRLSPAAFRRYLTTRARQAGKRIVLPEGSEPRTVEAAISCENKGIAHCVLLAPRDEVETTASRLGLTLPESIEIIDPTDIPQKYIDALVERRKHKGMTEAAAREQLCDSVVYGTVMVHLGEVDGLVSGAVHTTANTVRPALQILGTKPGAKLVSSVFFMGLPDEVVVYGDCAINPDPNADELADIAIQSADSAAAFGLDPRVAMISFSTGTSGSGADVEKVAAATNLVKELRPDIAVDGPLQYDAATTASVARSKAPDSPVAGKATVFVFPDLNTGNTTYKAVQRSASVISVGPMLQGIAAPVNDLSRGALVEDIEYTIALTAIQAAAPSA